MTISLHAHLHDGADGQSPGALLHCLRTPQERVAFLMIGLAGQALLTSQTPLDSMPTAPTRESQRICFQRRLLRRPIQPGKRLIR